MGHKAARYSMVSVVAIATTQLALLAMVVLLDWDPSLSNVIAVSAGAVPSYVLNRAWTWGKVGKSHLTKEVLPFWAISLFGLIFSTLVVGWATETWDGALVANIANIGAFGVLWVGKFAFLNMVLFKVHPTEQDASPGTVGDGSITVR